MRWEGRRQSQNVEDRRAQGGGGGGPRLPGGKGGLLVMAVVVIAGLYGVDLSGLMTMVDDPAANQSQQVPYQAGAKEQEAAALTSVVLADTEDTWARIFQQQGQRYQPPKLVLYRQATRTGCGTGQAVMGPFYCPADQTVYIDLSFYDDMAKRLGGGGDFAQGYVIAHEVGHHVQNLLGTERKVRQMQQGQSEKTVNQLSVRMELQADCYAGVWGHAMGQENILENGDLESALRTAEAIGDDRLQQQSSGRVVPDSFTHGSSEQRHYWFSRGFQSGDAAQCNTFSDVF
ncbi:neutral zinc metallopeptidase [Neisseriaceae bacterium CLB008]|nr:neutral zinc metallopeptidase [Neisseriaceae bacterium]